MPTYVGTNGKDNISNGISNVIYALDGDDVIFSSYNGALYIYGGHGIDTIDYSDFASGYATIYGGEGSDIIDGGIKADLLYGDNGHDQIEGGNGNDYIEGGRGDDLLYGGNGFDTLYGGDGADRISGGAESDDLDGGSGNDILDGGSGADTMIGGAGDDVFSVDHAGDFVEDGGTPAGGRDRVQSTVDFNLADLADAAGQIEDLTLVGNAKLTGTGNGLANTIIGNLGDNRLYGGAGDDVISGGAGNDNIDAQAGTDWLTGGAGADKFVYRQSLVATSGADHITDYAATDRIYFDMTSGPTGTLAAAAFRAGANALDADDRFIYNAPEEALYYDADGNGAAAKVKLAIFDNGYTPTAADIVLF